MSAYAELLAHLVPARRFGVVLGLAAMRALLDALGGPERRLGTVVHVAGTNGKGSTVAMIAALARAGGARVATYTSPHLSTLRERIVIDGELISEAAIVAAGDRVRAAGGDALTFFEQVTAIALVAIADAGVDVTVLEVGLGGRLDATNVVDAPIAVITGVALDHQSILGETLEAIAWEKAGIIKVGQRVVIGASGEPAAVPVLVALARPLAAHYVVIDDDAIAAVPPVALPGAHQRRNAAAALAAVAELAELGAVRVDAAARTRALGEVVHPGRFEVLAGGGVILDGAHNPHGAEALAAALRDRGVHPTLVLAVSADKDAAAIVRALAPAVGAIIATRYQQDRALDPGLLAQTIRAAAANPVTTAPDLSRALAAAPRPVVVAGSLFLVGEARTLLLGVPTDPIVATDPAAAPPPGRL